MRSLYIMIVMLILTGCSNCQSNDDTYCFDSAGESYGIDSDLLKAISYVESRHEQNALHVNKNGSLDYGHMQINSLWVAELGQTYTALNDPCYCTKVAAWILADCIDRYGYNSDAISCYNSGRPLYRLTGETRKNVKTYVKRVEKRFKELRN